MPVAGLCELGNCPQTTGCGVLRRKCKAHFGCQHKFRIILRYRIAYCSFNRLCHGYRLVGPFLGLLVAQVVCAVVMVVGQNRLVGTSKKSHVNAGQEEQSKIQGAISVMLVN